MNKREIEQMVAGWMEEITQNSDIELVDVEYVKEYGNYVLRVYIDKPGGVNVEDCREINLVLGKMLDDADPIDHSYTLEVSSPGLERPLKNLADYQRYTHRLVNVKTYQPVAGKKEHQGELIAVTEQAVTLKVKGELVEIPFASIAKARLAVEF